MVEADDQVKEWIPIIERKSRKHDMSEVHQKLDAGLRLLTQPDESPTTVLPSTQKCSRSLAFDKMDERFGNIEPATEGTCSWLPRHQMYQDWLESNHGLLWIRGKPGSGKSTLLRYILDQALSEFSSEPTSNGIAGNCQPPTLVLFFFFHGRGAELQKTPMGLFRTLLHQLLKQAPETLQDLVVAYDDRCQNRGDLGKDWQWQLRELKDFLSSALRKVLARRPVRLFVDALDEGGRDNAVNLVSWFKSLLKGLSTSTPATNFPCRVCFTCRHYPILSLDGGFQICVEHENGQDISTYVHDRLSESQISPDLIVQRANGVLLWCRLVLDKLLLLEMDADGDFEEEVERIPPDLDELYLNLINNMDKKDDSLRLMQWICFSSRPLNLDELRWAMLVDAQCPHQSLDQCRADKKYTSDNEMMKRRLRRIGCGLVETVLSVEGDHTVEIVQVIHQSVRDFFIQDGLSTLMGSNATGMDSISTSTDSEVAWAAHYQLLGSCIRYLCMRKFEEDSFDNFCVEPKTLVSDFPFCTYAITQWIYHAKRVKENMQPDIMGFFRWPSRLFFREWVRLYVDWDPKAKECPPVGSNMLHTAVKYGLTSLVRAIVESIMAGTSMIDIEAYDTDGMTALAWAARVGQNTCMKILMDTHKVDLDGTDSLFALTPLAWAAQKGHTSVVKMLLGCSREEVDVNSIDIGCTTPLSQAAYFGHDDIVELLLQVPETDVNTNDLHDLTPLLLAAGEGREAVVRRLINTDGVDADITDRNGWTPLIWSARNGHKSTMLALLNSGKVDVERRDQWGRTVLSWVAEYGHATVAGELVYRGKADVNTKDNNDATPLWWAAKEAHEEVVRVLLWNNKAEIDAKDSHGRTALFMAAKAGSEATVQLLLKMGKASIDTKTNQGETPLSIATSQGHLGVVKLLQDFAAASCVPAEQTNSALVEEDDSSTIVGESLASVNSFATNSSMTTANSSTTISRLAELDDLEIIDTLPIIEKSTVSNRLAVAKNRLASDDDFVLVAKNKRSELTLEEPLLA